MIFSLEALHAKHGDSLLLRFGDSDEPRLIAVDGGPTGVYKHSLKPRLEQLREAAGGTLPIEVLMVSHIDSDHINGVLEFSQDLIDHEDRRGGYAVGNLWFNSFEDIIKDSGAGAEGPVIPAGNEAIVASVNEGRRLRDNANGLHWPHNDCFKGEFVMAPNDAGVAVDLDPLKLTVIGPRKLELDKLRAEWEAKVAELRAEGRLEVAAAGEIDGSVPNLSSIACVAEMGDKRMLLTGDALGEKVLEGLETAGFLKQGERMDGLDLLKLPHHGSSRNNSLAFLERLPARHIVISANGKDDNPDLETLKRLSKARPDDEFTLHLTETDFVNGVGDEIRKFFAQEKAGGRKYGVEFCPSDELLRIDLLDAPPS